MLHNSSIIEQLWDELNQKLSNVSRETFESLIRYTEQLLKWNKTFNLVSKHYNENFLKLWHEQIFSCCNLYQFIYSKNYSDFAILDLGSGAGLPGIVLGIMGLKNIITIDRRFKKIAFQKHIIKQLNLDQFIQPICDDIKNFTSRKKMHLLIVSKAVAECNEIVKLTNHLLKQGDELLLLKNHTQIAEINNINQEMFDSGVHPNIFNINDHIFQLKLK